MQLDKDQAQINKLIARGSLCNQPIVRMRLTSQLSHANMQVSGMSPRAILLIRRLVDPCPRSLSTSDSLLHPPVEWQQALNQALETYYRQAARPQHGRLPADVEAIVFKDTAEMLACFCQRKLDTAVADWWWPAIFKEVSGNNFNLFTVLKEHILYLPELVASLHASHSEHALLHLLDKTQAWALSGLLLEAFDYSSLIIRLQQANMHFINEQLPQEDSETRSRRVKLDTLNVAPVELEVDEAIDKNGSSSQHADRGSYLHTLFTNILGNDSSAASGNCEHILLSGLARLLHQQPGLLSNRRFQQRLVDSWRGLDELNQASRVSNDLNASPEHDDVLQKDFNTLKHEDAIYPSDIDSGQPFDKLPDKQDMNVASENEIASQNNHDELQQSPAYEDFYKETGFTTDYGGILYVLNLMHWLDLPACFENDWRLASRISPWALLALLVHSLLEHANKLEKDPLWQFIRAMDAEAVHDSDNREIIESTPRYCIPQQWFDAVHHDKETFRWCEQEDSLYLWSAEGYLLVHTQRNSQASFIQAQYYLHKYLGNLPGALMSQGEPEQLPIETGHFTSPGLACIDPLPAYILPYIRYRLDLSSRLVNQQMLSAEMTNQLLQCRAHIYVTATHIDLVTPMENIVIAARRDGLDQDPGWLPWLGRVVSFHFE